MNKKSRCVGCTKEFLQKTLEKYEGKCRICHGKGQILEREDLVNVGCKQKKLCNVENCSFCYSKRFSSHPSSKLWSKKNTLPAWQVSRYSHKKFTFSCDNCLHEWEATVNKISNGRSCPFCNRGKLCPDNSCLSCLERRFELPQGISWSKENKEEFWEVSRYSHKKFTFSCDNCLHEWKAIVGDISKGGNCPFCNGGKLCPDNSCLSCLERRFELPQGISWGKENKEEFWEVSRYSSKKFTFSCNNCLHEWKATISNISNGKNCPFCNRGKLCPDNSCLSCLKRRFELPQGISWGKENKEEFWEVSRYSSKKFTFSCNNCLHEWKPTIGSVSNGRNCPFCNGGKLCPDNSCLSCLERRFKLPQGISWGKENKEEFWEVSRYSNKKFTFSCDNCLNEWKATVNKISNGTSCPVCVHKTERILLSFLKEKFEVEYQKRFAWCVSETTNRTLPFDFFLPQFQLIIELDGPQHKRQIANWASPEITSARDKYKEEKARENGLNVLRLEQEDVFYNRTDWKSFILDFIGRE